MSDNLQTLRAEAEQIVARYPDFPRSALGPILHLIQSVDGYVSPRGITLAADVLGLTRAEVSAVATFYSQYRRHPNGEYNVGVCVNPLCGVMGGEIIWDTVSEHLGIGHDETSEDGKITLERLECNAACDYAPVVMVNWEFFDNQTPESTVALVEEIKAGRDIHPTRGADKVHTFKEVSRVLAGFEDGHADEGPSAGEPTVLGRRLADEKGWAAPRDESAARTTRASSSKKEAAAGVTSADSAPKVGGAGSSAERTPTTSADSSATTVEQAEEETK